MNTEKVFLATTALEEFWDTTQPILFLGEWCKLFSRKAFWEKLNTRTLQISDLEEVTSLDAYHYTIEVYEKLLVELSRWLNRIHGTHFSLKYWRLLIGPFLLNYIQVVYHRLFYLKKAYSLYPNLDTIGLASSSYMTPINSSEFVSFASESHTWNLQLFTQIQRLLFKEPSRLNEFSWDREIKQRIISYGTVPKFGVLTRIRRAATRFFAEANASRLVGLCFAHDFSRANLFHLLFLSKFRIVPLAYLNNSIWESALGNNKPDLSIRKEITHLKADDDFSKIILETLIVNMPLNFIEFYKKEVEQSEKNFPYNPKVIVSTSWMLTDRIKFWGAKKAETGTKLINVQHGGCFGMVAYCSDEYLQRKNCDAFVSWGWKESKEVIPLPSVLVSEFIKSIRRKAKSSDRKKIILWPATEWQTYLHYIGGHMNDPYQAYVESQVRFASALKEEVFSQVVMRLRPRSSKVSFLQEKMPGIKIHCPNDKMSFYDQLADETKILISDNLSTTFLYSFALNIPTIVFCNSKIWSVREEVKGIFTDMRACGIYHDTPESAANMLNSIANDYESWWKSKEVQHVRRDFCGRFASFESNWINRWVETLVSYV